VFGSDTATSLGWNATPVRFHRSTGGGALAVRRIPHASRTVVVVVLAASAAVAACSAADPPPGPTTFADVDAAMNRRVHDDDLDGAAVLVVQHGQTIHRSIFGRWHGDETVNIASASKWLTAATLMTLVDEGQLGLDDPIANRLPEF